jgi:hypothetical protein
MSIEVREATIAAIVAGAVVIVLGYASGLGLHVPLIQAATVKPTPAVSAPIAVPTPARILPAEPAFVTIRSVAPTAPVLTFPHPSAPAPTPTATPTPTPPACTPGLLSGLLAPVDSLLGGLLGGILVPTSGSTSAPTSGSQLGCTLDGLLGSSCCIADARTTTKTAAR